MRRTTRTVFTAATLLLSALPTSAQEGNDKAKPVAPTPVQTPAREPNAAEAYRRLAEQLRDKFGADCAKLPEIEDEGDVGITTAAAASAEWRRAVETAAPVFAQWQLAVAEYDDAAGEFTDAPLLALRRTNKT